MHSADQNSFVGIAEQLNFEINKTLPPWRERAEVRLESADFARLSALTGELLQSMKMAGMDFSIATDTRKTREDAMLKDAVNAFKARAQLATEALHAKAFAF